MKRKEPTGYIVFWWDQDNDFGLVQRLRVEEKTPDHGILMSANRGQSATVFKSREQAKEAIREHHHYMQCHYSKDSDDSKRMVIVPLIEAPEIPTHG